MKDGNYVDRDGDTVWVLDGYLHRTDGPAVIWASGIYINGTFAWYLDGNVLTFDKWLEVNNQITEEEKVMLKLQYG